MSSLKQVRTLASEYVATGDPLHVLVLNAGFLVCWFVLAITWSNVSVLTYTGHMYSIQHVHFTYVYNAYCKYASTETSPPQHHTHTTHTHTTPQTKAQERKESEDGYELSFATQTLVGTFVLARLLQPVLLKSQPSTIVIVSSGGMYTGMFWGWVCVQGVLLNVDKGR